MHSRYPPKTPGIKNSWWITKSCSTPIVMVIVFIRVTSIFKNTTFWLLGQNMWHRLICPKTSTTSQTRQVLPKRLILSWNGSYGGLKALFSFRYWLWGGPVKTSQECETALTSQYQTLFLGLSFCPFVPCIFVFCVFVFLSFCLFVFLSKHHSDQMSVKGLKSQKSLFVSKF